MSKHLLFSFGPHEYIVILLSEWPSHINQLLVISHAKYLCLVTADDENGGKKLIKETRNRFMAHERTIIFKHWIVH